MIISASRRTDIPSYYSEWFINRIREGTVWVRNPMNKKMVSKVTLSPDVVDCIVFWTKDPLPMIPYLNELDQKGYNYYFQFTVTPYENDIEKRLRRKADIIATFKNLSELIGHKKIVWRYDPIIITSKYSIEFHKESFLNLFNQLSSCCNHIIISFIDLYQKIKKENFLEVSQKDQVELALFIGALCKKKGIKVTTCCESMDLSDYGIFSGSCIDISIIENVCNSAVKLKKDKSQRKSCLCYESIDIGAYDTCLHGCSYCYATKACLTSNIYQSQSQILGSDLNKEEDKIYDKVVKSNKSGQ